MLLRLNGLNVRESFFEQTRRDPGVSGPIQAGHDLDTPHSGSIMAR